MDIASEISSLLSTFSAALTAKGFHPKLELDTAMPVRCDVLRMRQALIALLDNALKHATPGSLTLRLYRAGNSWHLCVEDEGPGITDEAARYIFDAFRRIEPSRSRQSGGSGLGLAVVQAIAEAHGGNEGDDAAHSITVISMGPERATEAVRKALSMGANDAILITDPTLAGSDALMTSKVLSQVISAGGYDLVICGTESTDAVDRLACYFAREFLVQPLGLFFGQRHWRALHIAASGKGQQRQNEQAENYRSHDISPWIRDNNIVP